MLPDRLIVPRPEIVVLMEPGGVDTGIWDSADADFAKGSSSRYRPAYKRTKQGIVLSRRFMASPQSVAKMIVRATRLPVAISWDREFLHIYQRVVTIFRRFSVAHPGPPSFSRSYSRRR